MKTRLLLLLCPFTSLSVSAQVAGPSYPNAFSNAMLPGYTQQWIDIANVQYEDENYASFGNLPETIGSHTDYLVATDFGFQIPAGTIINGIKVEVNCSDINSRTSDYSVRIVKTGIIAGQEKAMNTPYPSIDKYISYGGPSDMWGETWDYKYIDDNHFGVAIAAQRNSGDDMITAGRVNDIRITVYYSFITLPLTLVDFFAEKQDQSVKLNWKTANESGMEKFILERSSNGSAFKHMVEIPASNQQAADYSWTDDNLPAGTLYYRLKMQGTAGYLKYSKVLSVRIDKTNQCFLYPSPWKSEIPLMINNNRNEKLVIYFLNEDGQTLSTASTETKLVPTETLTNRKGLLYYKIFDSKKKNIGSGSILIL